MDEITGFAFFVVMIALGFYILYCVIRAAVAGGIRDAARKAERTSAEREAAATPHEPPAR